MSCVGGSSLISRVVDASLATCAVSTTVVVGHGAEQLRTELLGKDVLFATSSNYKRGLAESLKTGLSSLPAGIDGVMILLADMPFVTGEHINALLFEFKRADKKKIVVPVWDDRRGNPVIWPNHYIPRMMKLKGDQGARSILQEYAEDVLKVPMPSDAVVVDVDTPAQLDAAQARYEARSGSV